MAKAGNHGRIIPRDKSLLHSLYWDQQKTLPEIGAIYGVNHKSVLAVFRALDIPTRGVGKSRHTGCIECGAPIFRIKHASNGSLYGKRCRQHWNEHRAALAREDLKRPETRERKRKEIERWYLNGAQSPKDGKSWLIKAKAYLRTAKRVLATGETRTASRSRKRASVPDQTSRT